MSCVLVIVVLFNAYQPIGAYSSLYFAPYLTDVVGLDTAVISVLGIVNSLFMLSVYLFAVPAMSHFNKLFSLTVGLSVQILSMFLRIFLACGQPRLGGGVGSAVLGGVWPVPSFFGRVNGRGLSRDRAFWYLRPQKCADFFGVGVSGESFRIFVPVESQEHLSGVDDPAGGMHPVYFPIFPAEPA